MTPLQDPTPLTTTRNRARMSTPDRSTENWVWAVAATGATAVSGSVATDTRSAWYRRIDKPSWQPPGVVFPVV